MLVGLATAHCRSLQMNLLFSLDSLVCNIDAAIHLSAVALEDLRICL